MWIGLQHLMFEELYRLVIARWEQIIFTRSVLSVLFIVFNLFFLVLTQGHVLSILETEIRGENQCETETSIGHLLCAPRVGIQTTTFWWKGNTPTDWATLPGLIILLIMFSWEMKGWFLLGIFHNIIKCSTQPTWEIQYCNQNWTWSLGCFDVLESQLVWLVGNGIERASTSTLLISLLPYALPYWLKK